MLFRSNLKENTAVRNSPGTPLSLESSTGLEDFVGCFFFLSSSGIHYELGDDLVFIFSCPHFLTCRNKLTGSHSNKSMRGAQTNATNAMQGQATNAQLTLSIS